MRGRNALHGIAIISARVALAEQLIPTEPPKTEQPETLQQADRSTLF